MSIRRTMLLGLPAVLLAVPIAGLAAERMTVKSFASRAERVREGSSREEVEAAFGAADLVPNPKVAPRGAPSPSTVTRVEYQRTPDWMRRAGQLPFIGSLVPQRWQNGWELIVTYDGSGTVTGTRSLSLSNAPFIYVVF